MRACKTAAEERTVISKESAALRNAFKNQDQTYRHRNVAKLMFIHMLGYPTHFGQMETLKLIAANGFPEKVRQYCTKQHVRRADDAWHERAENLTCLQHDVQSWRADAVCGVTGLFATLRRG